jgi:hypothetical protein
LALIPNKSNITDVLRKKVSNPNPARSAANMYGMYFFTFYGFTISTV